MILKLALALIWIPVQGWIWTGCGAVVLWDWATCPETRWNVEIHRHGPWWWPSSGRTYPRTLWLRKGSEF
jgi:hypothetical protein